MFNIDKYLEKFSKNLQSLERNKGAVLEIIKNHTGLEIPSGAVEIKDAVLFLKISPAQKNQVFIHKRAILEDLDGNISEKVIDIK